MFNSVVAKAYVAAVGGLAAVGFGSGSTPLILVAIVVTLPGAIALVPAYYVCFGLLALVPGANPSESTGGASCSAAGRCAEWTSGGEAAWFVVVTDVLGVVALVVAAVLDVWLWRAVVGRALSARAVRRR